MEGEINGERDERESRGEEWLEGGWGGRIMERLCSGDWRAERGALIYNVYHGSVRHFFHPYTKKWSGTRKCRPRVAPGGQFPTPPAACPLALLIASYSVSKKFFL